VVNLEWKRVVSLKRKYMVSFQRNQVICLSGISNQPTAFSGMTISYNATFEQEVDEVLKQVEALGATIIKPAQKVYWGGYSGYFKDLDGYLFEVAYNPFWELDENDNLKL
jgi:uncharacterized glyoxalase superfamily protein PhnB